MKDLVVTENLSKIYDVGKVKYPALHGLSIVFYSGEFVAIVGPSGSGKSTLLHLIGGLDKPTEGKVIVNGSDLSKLDSNKLAEYRNREVGFIFQFFNLIPYLSAIENIELSMSIAGTDSRNRRSKALTLLETFGLKDKASKRPTELSGGEQQRIAIARALANDPALILADEPTGNVDSETAKVIVNAFRKLVDEKEVSIIMVTHNLDLRNYCDRIVNLRDGKLESVEMAAK